MKMPVVDFRALDLGDIERTWTQRGHHFADFIGSTQGRWTVAGLLHDIAAGRKRCAGVDDATGRALCTIWFVVSDYHARRALTVLGASGRGAGVHRWVGAARDGIEAIAKAERCDFVEGFGRRGYRAFFPAECRADHVYYCAEVSYGQP